MSESSSPGSRWPDLVIGLLIVAVVIRGGIQILKDAAGESTEAGAIMK